jgi:hypothetical protein
VTPAEIAEAQARMRADERETDRDVIRNYLPITQAAMAELTPGDWVRLARLCRGVNSWSGFAGPLGEPFRYFFGCLAADLYTEAQARDEPIDDATPAIEEAYHARVERILAESARRRHYGEVASGPRGPRMGSRP